MYLSMGKFAMFVFGCHFHLSSRLLIGYFSLIATVQQTLGPIPMVSLFPTRCDYSSSLIVLTSRYICAVVRLSILHYNG